jgi:DNA-binding MarR family transcriptional regulator
VLSTVAALFERDVLRLTQEGEFGWVTRVHLALFRNLDFDGARLTVLAARAGVTKQSMQELVDKAEAFGVVERRPAPDDRRAKIVAFSPAGLRMMDQFREGVAQAERRLAAAIGAEFLAEAKARLGDYVAAADDPASGQSGPASQPNRAES